MIVRLKDRVSCTTQEERLCFNSMIVRLKGNALYASAQDMKFQFYDSPIKRFREERMGWSGAFVSIL